MKKIKCLVFIFTLTLITSVFNIKADSYLGFASITIPSMSGVYTSPTVRKTTFSEQYIMKIGAIDKLSGDERAIGARLKNISNTYVLTTKNAYTKLKSQSSLGLIPAEYQLQLKANKWTLSAIYFSGTWVLDDYLI
jgi:F0F1-type ATP synthase assembly protein I